MRKLLIIILIICSPSKYLDVQAASAVEESTKSSIEAGKDYRLLGSRTIDSATDLSQLQKVADIEIFYWFGCTSCLQAEQAIESYAKDHPELVVKKTPLIPFPSWRAQAYIQPMIEQLEGKVQLPTREQLYQQCISDCSPFASFELIKSWLKTQYSIEELPRLDEPAIWQAEKNFRKRAQSFSISQVPTIIVREAYATDANSTGSVQRLVEVVDYLLKRQ
ncbi:hypothetical protein [Aliikangiella sp. G2MR2-5]|uniref:hypothetical protein n=1 Tax=Aliikangiella sp. G2MR2-5 TaxID=2788943 RepID=UPI0018A9158D|nr:hypothetical protein [Aliikangiella sp. G2MR2-5]